MTLLEHYQQTKGDNCYDKICNGMKGECTKDICTNNERFNYLDTDNVTPYSKMIINNAKEKINSEYGSGGHHINKIDKEELTTRDYITIRDCVIAKKNRLLNNVYTDKNIEFNKQEMIKELDCVLSKLVIKVVD